MSSVLVLKCLRIKAAANQYICRPWQFFTPYYNDLIATEHNFAEWICRYDRYWGKEPGHFDRNAKLSKTALSAVCPTNKHTLLSATFVNTVEAQPADAKSIKLPAPHSCLFLSQKLSK